MMISYRHVATFGAANTRWLSNVSDLAAAQVGGSWALFAVNPTGGISSYRITDPGAPLVQVATRGFPSSLTYHAQPSLTVLTLAAGDRLLVEGLGGAGMAGLRVDKAAGMGAIAQLFSADRLGTRLSASGQMSGTAGDFLFSARQDSLGIDVSRIGGNGALSVVSSVTLPMPAGVAEASLDKIILMTVDGQRLLVAISGLGNFVSTHAIGADGVLGRGAMHVAGAGAGYYVPSDLAAIQFGDDSFVVMAGAASSSLSVFRVGRTGALTITDHVVDEQTTRFQSVSALATVVADGRGLVIAGGVDGGISIFALLPNGRLLHLENIVDTATTTLSRISAIEAQVIEGRIVLFVASQGETGLTQFVIDPGAIGKTAMAGSGSVTGTARDDLLVAGSRTTALQGGAGDDILVSGHGNVALTGGAGADTFVVTRYDGRVAIADYEPGMDRLDLSMLGMIRSTWQLDFSPQSWGMRITYGNSILEIRTKSGKGLQPSDFGNGMFPIGHYWLPELDPVKVQPPPSTVGKWVFGTDAADQLLGADGPDAIQARAGNDTVSGGSGDDTVDGGPGHDRIRGGAGDDQLWGRAGNDTLFGDDGADLIRGDDGHDLIYGGLGNDTLRGGSHNDRLYGGGGKDRIQGDGGNDTLSGEGNNDYLEDLSGDNLLMGGSGTDTLVAGSGADRLYGGPGNDVLKAGSGNDLLNGEAGSDKLYGGGGNDRLSDPEGNNKLYGEDGNDSLTAGSGADWLLGGRGHDVLRGGSGADRLYGDADRDKLYGEAGNDLLSGGTGSDTLYGGLGNDRMDGGSGNDVLRGQEGNDTLLDLSGNNRLGGDSGNDTLRAGSGADRLHGGSGNDSLRGGAGNDWLYGEAGNDRLYGEAGNDILEDLLGNNRLDGGTGNDHLLAGSGRDTLIGGTGNDMLRAGAGNDMLMGEAGNDKLYGQAGDDSLTDLLGSNILVGGTGRDSLVSGSGNDRLYGDAGNDHIRSGAGQDRLYGGMGNDRMMGGAGNDLLRGEDGDDVLWGDSGNDSLYGGAGNDVLKGGTGLDRLWGDAGNDTLEGGAGKDYLRGGAGADDFRFLSASDSRPAAADLILDFRPDLDDLDLRGLKLRFIDDDPFSGSARQLRWDHVGAETHVMADLNGNGRADFLVRLAGHLDLDRGDFIL